MADRAPARPRLRDALNLFWTLFWQDFTPRSRRESFKLVWAFAEPAGQLLVLIAAFSLIGRLASYGNSFPLFLLTGVITLTTFTQTAAQVLSAVQSLRSANRLAPIGLFHAALARVAFQLVVGTFTTIILAVAIAVATHAETAPHHVPRVAAAFLAIGLLGFGVGLIRGWSMTFLPVVERIYAIAARVLIFVSGVFFVPSFMPPQLREWLVWNPILHAVELMRMGFYDQYPSILFSPGYLLGAGLGSTALGMMLLWRNRARLMG
jgi:capsular polysaccharide transport system permease protein